MEDGGGRPLNAAPKIVVCLLGAPGAGKTTQIEEITSATDAEVFHMGKFAQSQGLTPENNQQRSSGKLLAGSDADFLHHALQSDSRYIILDGYPRSVEQAALLVATLHTAGYALSVVHL